MRPLRLYKFLDCLESLGFVERPERGDDITATSYRAVPGLRAAVLAVVGDRMDYTIVGADVNLARASRRRARPTKS